MENPPIERDQLLRWVEIFQAPTSEELSLYDEPSRGASELYGF
jgi:hypothetical protein